ncbi:MAG: hypothetical protein WCK05_16645 [Planctomycetota bacterium]|jgi:hypothetical protein
MGHRRTRLDNRQLDQKATKLQNAPRKTKERARRAARLATKAK